MDHRSSSYVMWSGKRSGIEQLRSRPCPSFGSAAYTYPSDEASCEEQAFAEDTLMLMHVWPPRSYSCTFCHREFRSAQALGGHMNVHRRDRARLRQQQQPSSPDSLTPGDREIRNPNTPPSDDRAARNRSPDNCNYLPSSLSAANDRQPKDQRSAARDEVQSLPKDFSQSIRDQSLLKRKDHCHSEVDELEDQVISTKRRCVAPAELPLFFSSNSQIEMQRHLRNKVAIKSTAGCPNDELDLELRLGNCPEVMS